MRKYYFSKKKFAEAEKVGESELVRAVWPEFCDGKEVDVCGEPDAFEKGQAVGSISQYSILRDWCVVEDSSGDAVLHPGHYCRNGHECIDLIRAVLTEEEFRGYCKGNCIKYIFRCEEKGGEEDIRKAIQYLRFLLGEDGLQAASGEREVAGK